jgi:glycine/D-amino acid oxidase-like deaminating enzyme
VHHLALLGWRDLVLVDKGPMPNPGGSTGHASNFIFPIEYSKMMFELTTDSTAQYKELGVFTESGGIEVARTAERMIELRRRCTQAKAWGIPAELITPGEVNKLVPYLDESVILGGAHFPTVGVVDSLRAGTLMRERAQQPARSPCWRAPRCTASPVSGGGSRGGDDQRGRDRDRQRGHLLRGLVAADRPDGRGQARAHPDRAPDDQRRPDRAVRRHAGGDLLPDRPRRGHQHVRAPARRRHGGRLLRAPPDHRPPDEIPSIEESVLSPTELPFTQDDFDPQLEQALELMPELLGDEKAGIRYAINGLISMTPTGTRCSARPPRCRGLWSAAASWIKEGPGCGRAVAELMSGQVPTVDVHEADAPGSTRTSDRRARPGRAREGFNKMYGIVHPAEQWESGRPLRVSPVYERERELGAVFYETAGWERPFWYASNAPLLDRYAGRLMDATAEWESRWWSPIINAEHLAMRDACAPGRPVRLRRLRRHRARRARRGAALSVAQLDVPGRPGRLHLVARRERRVPRRPDRHAAGRGPVPGGDRRRDRDVRRQVDQRPPATTARASPTSPRPGPRSGCGGRGPGTCWPR